MNLNKYSIAVTTTTATTDTFYTTGCLFGDIVGVQYVRDTGSPISSTADLAITGNVSGFNILTSLSVGAASFMKYPKTTCVNTTNGAITNSFTNVFVNDEKIKLTVSKSSAALLTGTFYIYSDGAR